jgi:hypothetical protein
MVIWNYAKNDLVQLLPLSFSEPSPALCHSSSSKRCLRSTATKPSKHELNTAPSHIYIWETRFMLSCRYFCIVLCRASICQVSSFRNKYGGLWRYMGHTVADGIMTDHGLTPYSTLPQNVCAELYGRLDLWYVDAIFLNIGQY